MVETKMMTMMTLMMLNFDDAERRRSWPKLQDFDFEEIFKFWYKKLRRMALSA